ncbi:hypothetical protein [Nocardiopsis halotolerans]|uniref:hypothetical protein n=1 Tax=Nocardiopsis halotolerans TaxID=124252 RepID=UPI0003459429|nr:hypothetical protein [Nocardiopsis halotolerans]
MRRYANPAPALPTGQGFDTATADVPRVPSPRRAPDAAPRTSPFVDPLSGAEPADIVRGYYHAFEARQRVRGGRASAPYEFAEAVAV